MKKLLVFLFLATSLQGYQIFVPTQKAFSSISMYQIRNNQQMEELICAAQNEGVLSFFRPTRKSFFQEEILPSIAFIHTKEIQSPVEEMCAALTLVYPIVLLTFDSGEGYLATREGACYTLLPSPY